MPAECDVLIVGGSVAGSSLAIHLGRRGLRTVLCDKARFPRRKACGEGLLPHGAAELESLGLGDPPGTRVSGLRYFAPSGLSATARFDLCGLGPGWVVHRDDFDRWLLDHARATPNVDVREGNPVEDVATAGAAATIVVGADGLHSIFHRQLPFRRIQPRRARVGMSAVVRGYDAGDTVDIFLGRGGEAYVGPTGNGDVSLALLLEKGTRPEQLLASIPAFRDIEIARSFIGVGPLGSVVTPVVHGRALLIGDAAGAVDPITGEGMSLALISSRVAAEAIQEAVETGDLRVLERYVEARGRMFAPARRLSKMLLTASAHPTLADRAVRKLAKDPGLFARLLRSACGGAPVGLLDQAALVL